MQSMKIAVAASFTAEPLADSLHFWSEKLHWHADISFAPYNQIFQQLLDPTSLLSTDQHGINLVLVRPEDWVRYEEQRKTQRVSDSQDKIEQSARELVEALRSAAQ